MSHPTLHQALSRSQVHKHLTCICRCEWCHYCDASPQARRASTCWPGAEPRDRILSLDKKRYLRLEQDSPVPKGISEIRKDGFFYAPHCVHNDLALHEDPHGSAAMLLRDNALLVQCSHSVVLLDAQLVASKRRLTEECKHDGGYKVTTRALWVTMKVEHHAITGQWFEVAMNPAS